MSDELSKDLVAIAYLVSFAAGALMFVAMLAFTEASEQTRRGRGEDDDDLEITM